MSRQHTQRQFDLFSNPETRYADLSLNVALEPVEFLKWKEKTHWERLQDYILQVAHEKEFFLRKACGWALREYSKSRPDRVQSFIEKYRHHLSGLTNREGSKYL